MNNCWWKIWKTDWKKKATLDASEQCHWINEMKDGDGLDGTLAYDLGHAQDSIRCGLCGASERFCHTGLAYKMVSSA